MSCNLRRSVWRYSMRSAFIFSIIGVLAFTSVVQAQDIQGTPGVDYPNFFTIPETSFKCSEQKYNPGFYADLETKCQAFHFCYQDRQESFLCPTGTIFSQAVLTCDVWHKSNCSLAPVFYSVNAGPVMERAGKNLPMLLRLRNRSRDKPSVPTSTSSVLGKVSLHEMDSKAPEILISEDESEKLKGENGDVANSLKDLNNEDREETYLGKKELYSATDATKQTYESELLNENDANEESDVNLVYDSMTDRYFNSNQYEAELQDSDPASDDRFSFYDYGNVADGSDSSEQQLNDINQDESLEDSDFSLANSEYAEFAKRSFETGQSLKRLRRKPMYVVLDDEPDTEPDMVEMTGNSESYDALAKSETRRAKEVNVTSDEAMLNDEVTSSPEPFPRPTRIPPHLLELSTETPMTSDEFGAAIFTELVAPHLPDNYGTLLASTYPEDRSALGGDVLSDARSEETTYIENDVEPENYETYISQYQDVVVPQTYSESPDQVADSSDLEDTFVVIPDEYDGDVADSISDGDLAMQDHPEGNMYRTLSDSSRFAGYDAYGNPYMYSSSMNYPERYDHAFTPEASPMLIERVVAQNWPRESYQGLKFNPEMTSERYQDWMNDQRYDYPSGYELQGQLPMSYVRSGFDADSYIRAELNEKAELGVTDSSLEMPVTEAYLNFPTSDLNEYDSEQDLVEDDDQPEDVYYVLDLDEDQSNETKLTKGDGLGFNEASPESSENVEQNTETKQINSSNEPVSRSNAFLGIDGETDDPWSSKSPKISQNEQINTSDNVKSATLDTNPKNSLPGSNLESGPQPTSPTHEHLSAMKTPPFSSNLGSFDFSTDSRFLNDMGYSESMDFGPYGCGTNMGQFGMLESMQQSKTAIPFSQRMGQNEQPKLSTLSAIQEKVRSMKHGKFGAFKKYISSTNVRNNA